MTQPAATRIKTARKAPVPAPADAAVAVAPQPVRKPAPRKAATPPVSASRASRPAARTAPAAASAETQPSLRFYHSESLRLKTNAVLGALEASPERPGHGDAMADLVSELIEAGMDYYFMRALRQAEVGFVAEQSARLGISGALKLIGTMNRKFIVRMDSDQLLVVARHIRELS
jgi:hypothetical protein